MNARVGFVFTDEESDMLYDLSRFMEMGPKEVVMQALTALHNAYCKDKG